MRDILSRMGKDISQANSQITSNTNSSDNDNFCKVCGRESICGSLGVITYDVPVEHAYFGRIFRCPNNPIELDDERRERFRSLSNLSAYTDKTFENFISDLHGLTPTQARSLEIARSQAAQFANNPQGWLLLQGTYGCGKTHLGAAIGNARLNHGDMVLFITTPDLLDHLRSTYGPTSEVAYDQMYERISSAQILILDDLGSENPSPWAQEKLYQLLNHRYSHRLPTVITTNNNIDSLDPRIRSRILDENLTRYVQIMAPDYRTPGKGQYNVMSDLSNYGEMTFESFDTELRLNAEERKNMLHALNAAQAYAENSQGWLVILGAYGVGKTHLAAAIAHYQHHRGKNVIFVTAPNLLDYLREAFNPGAPVTFGQLFNTVRDASLLILDDLGTENASSWAKEKLFQIIDHRYASHLPTVITTSKNMDELDRRIVSRLRDHRQCRNIAIIGPDYPARIKR